MWPFAKLLNGFGSHIYLYSPILLDSQDLSHIIYPRDLQHAGCAAAPDTTTIPPEA